MGFEYNSWNKQPHMEPKGCYKMLALLKKYAGNMLLLSEVKEHKNHGMAISWGVTDGFRRSKLDCSTSMEAHNLPLFTHWMRILDVHSSATNSFISCKVKLTLKLEFICLDVKRNDWFWPAVMYVILWLVWVCNLLQTDACNLPTNKLKICTVAFLFTCYRSSN